MNTAFAYIICRFNFQTTASSHHHVYLHDPQSTAWDYWFWTDMVRQGRDIIVPEVPRTAHAGRYGTHTSGLAAMMRDARKPISTDPLARVDISG